jgi:hypothetical protein
MRRCLITLVSLWAIVAVASDGPVHGPEVLVGVWHDLPVFPESECDGFLLFYADGRFAWRDCSRFDDDCIVMEARGLWTLANQTVSIEIDRACLIDGGKAETSGGCLCEFDVRANDDPQCRSEPQVVKVELEEIAIDSELSDQLGTERWRFQFEGSDYWWIESDPKGYESYFGILGQEHER